MGAGAREGVCGEQPPERKKKGERERGGREKWRGTGRRRQGGGREREGEKVGGGERDLALLDKIFAILCTV
jgi:hypothetical protein